MREILFKAKTERTNKWEEGSFLKEEHSGLNHIYFPQGRNYAGIFYPIKRKTLCQYTGLKDKNGVKIFEGDYLVDKYPIDEEDLSKGYYESLRPVVWEENTLQWFVDVSLKKDGSFLTSLTGYFGDSLEVRGNIHD